MRVVTQIFAFHKCKHEMTVGWLYLGCLLARCYTPFFVQHHCFRKFLLICHSHTPYDWSRVISEHLPLLGRNPQVWHPTKPPKRTTIWIHLSVGQNWHRGRCSFQHCTWKFFIKASTIWRLFCVNHCWSILPQLAGSWFIGPCDGAISFSKKMPNPKIINQLIQNSTVGLKNIMTISCPALWHHCQTTLIYVPAIAGNVLRSDAEKLIANLPEPRKHRNLKRNGPNGTLDSGQDLSLHP